jgi:hypothetical protein
MRAPFRIFGSQEDFAESRAGEPRRQAVTPAASNAAAEPHAAAILARWARSPTPCVIVRHSWANWARLSSLSAIKSCLRDASGVR